MKNYIATLKSGFELELTAKSLKEAKILSDRIARTDGDKVLEVKWIKK